MAITYKIYDFPDIPIADQIFYVPGAYSEGGFTSGGAAISTFEPGGGSTLEIKPSLQVDEWSTPFASWIMSKTNGQFIRVRLAPTPQILTQRSIQPGGDGVAQPIDPRWTVEPQATNLAAPFTTVALEGTMSVTIDMSRLGPILKVGHVFGHDEYCYLVDEITYSSLGIATVTTNPPLRKDIAIDDPVEFRPTFLGMIVNGAEIRTAYSAANAGNIQLNNIVLREVRL